MPSDLGEAGACRGTAGASTPRGRSPRSAIGCQEFGRRGLSLPHGLTPAQKSLRLLEEPFLKRFLVLRRSLVSLAFHPDYWSEFF